MQFGLPKVSTDLPTFLPEWKEMVTPKYAGRRENCYRHALLKIILTISARNSSLPTTSLGNKINAGSERKSSSTTEIRYQLDGEQTYYCMPCLGRLQVPITSDYSVATTLASSPVAWQLQQRTKKGTSRR